MKLEIIKVLIIVLISFFSCKVERGEENFESQLTVERAKEIIERYGLQEGTISFGVNNVGDGKTNISESEFIEMVAQIAEYQNSEEGVLAAKLNNFYRNNQNLTKQKIDSFNLELDSEFNNKITGILSKSLKNKDKRVSDSIVSYSFSSHDKYE